MDKIKNQNDVFKFVALRPPTEPKQKNGNSSRIVDSRHLNETPVGKLINELEPNSHIGQVLPHVMELVNKNNWGSEIQGDKKFKVIVAVSRIIENQVRIFESEKFHRQIENAIGDCPKIFIQSDYAFNLQCNLWDRLHAFYLINRVTPVNLEGLMEGLKSFHILGKLAKDDEMVTLEDLQAAYRGVVVLPEEFVRIAPEKVEGQLRSNEKNTRNHTIQKHISALWDKYVELHEAAEEIQMLQPIIELKQEEQELDQEKLDEFHVAKNTTEKSNLKKILYRSSFTFDPADLEALSQTARVMIENSKNSDQFNKPQVLKRIHEELAAVTEQLYYEPRLIEKEIPDAAKKIPGTMIFMNRNFNLESLKSIPSPSDFPFPWSIRSQIRPLGIGDLKVVKQTLERYVAGEVAHIENVMQGESKERKHRRYDRTEESLTIELESTEETERDTQSTDRFELKKEVENTIQTDMKVDTGITVSSSYGPVKFGAHANFAYNQSTRDSARVSSNFSKEVLDRSIAKIQKKSREERITKTIQEVEEINTHSINNIGTEGHITGVYRWVDKHYKAQIFNYGKRMMFEFVVPEPAAFFKYAQANNSGNAINVTKPIPLGEITASDINESNYLILSRNYNVQGITPPPPSERVVSYALDKHGLQMKEGFSQSVNDLKLPEGYYAETGFVASSVIKYMNPEILKDQYYIVTIGRLVQGYFDQPVMGGFLNKEENFLPITVNTMNIDSYTIVVSVICHISLEHFRQWQIKTFELIQSAYTTAMAQYEEKLRAAEARRGVVITGYNPNTNRDIERTELKKHSISMLTGQRYTEFNAVSGNPPEFDLVEAASEGRFIQFFEQAFEWEQMTYLFYPYFWGRKDNWATVSNTYDNDPLFTKFLQAGSARIVIPVHPAYNEAILYYLQTGELWNGGDAPVIDDPLYIGLCEELRAKQDDLENAVPEGDPWTVVLPTTLVWLQAGPELPDYRQH
ncbi:hypothetical protein C173_12015 [Paenibacillus sp. FSL R7-277]|uniref:hypothetical protein n=1 Tax=unclassified Paenibacillus TaxID=185978 RepID=UPI0003E1F509|nr:hypothetical protein [Paenibacillus sp. FSL R7-277]ETT73301.1 hypothetical protein C173_12015 [Paenibacillus sp. FSL R7-277]